MLVECATQIAGQLKRPTRNAQIGLSGCKFELRLVATAAAASAAVIAAASTTAAAAGTALLRLEAIAAEDRTIASRFKRNRSLLAAARTNYRSSRGGT